MLKPALLGMGLAMAVAGGLETMEARASAAAVMAVHNMGTMKSATAGLTQIQFFYDPYRFGPRYTYPLPGYRYEYGSYYYRVPWWDRPYPGVVSAAPPSPPAYYGRQLPGARFHRGKAHVRWCLDRYRTYDPASNTYIGFDGLSYRCVNPY